MRRIALLKAIKLMSQPEQKKITAKDIGELHPKEAELIYLIRTQYRFGSIEIYLRDGLPEDIIKTVKRHRLGNGVPIE